MENLRPIILIGTTDTKELVNAIQKKLQILLSPQQIESELIDYTFFKDT